MKGKVIDISIKLDGDSLKTKVKMEEISSHELANVIVKVEQLKKDLFNCWEKETE